jgi:hypothetical protein
MADDKPITPSAPEGGKRRLVIDGGTYGEAGDVYPSALRPGEIDIEDVIAGLDEQAADNKAQIADLKGTLADYEARFADYEAQLDAVRALAEG